MISGPGVVSARASPRTISLARQPAVGLDRRLGDVGQHGVGTTEGHQRHPAEEDPLVDEDRVRSRVRASDHAATGVTQSATPTDQDRSGSVASDGRAWCSASSEISGGVVALGLGPLRDGQQRRAPAAERPADDAGAEDDERERQPEHREREEGGRRRARRAPGCAARGRRSGAPPGPRWPAPPGPGPRNSPVTSVVSPWATYRIESASMRDHAGDARRGRPRSARRASR